MADEDTPLPNMEPAPVDQERIDKMQPMVDLVNSEAFTTVMEQIAAIQTQYVDESIGYAHIYAVSSTMPRLKEWALAQ